MELILLIGIPGSGKSTFFRERFFDTHVRINLDMLKTRSREKILFDACLEARLPMVVDNTNVNRTERARFIPKARQAGYRVVGYYFEPDLRSSLGRNNQRSGKARIPAGGVMARYRLLEPPEYGEGFDELYRVRIDSLTSQFIVADWRKAARES